MDVIRSAVLEEDPVPVLFTRSELAMIRELMEWYGCSFNDTVRNAIRIDHKHIRSQMTDAGINGELYPYTFWLNDEDEKRLKRIAKTSRDSGISYDEVVSEALMWYHDCLTVCDKLSKVYENNTEVK